MKNNKSKEERMQFTKQPNEGGALTLFQDKASLTGFEIKSRSPMVKPSAFPLGKVLVGTFKRLITCEAAPAQGKEGSKDYVPAKMGNLMEIIPVGQTVGLAIPTTAVIKTALEIKGEGDEAESPYLGRVIAIERLDQKIPSKRGNDAWNFIVAVKPE